MMGMLLASFSIILAQEGKHGEYLEQNPTFTLHRYMGYGIAVGSVINLGTGLYLLNQHENGKVPPDYLRITHRAIGYTIFTASIVQASLGTYNNIKLWKEEGRLKRLIHGALAYAATGSYLYGGYMAYKGKLETHRNFMLLASGLAAIAGIVIIF